TPAKLDTSGPCEALFGQGPPAPHLLLSQDLPAATLLHASQDPSGSSVGRCHDATTITDLCNSGNIPEVEIISLLGEQLPRYTLRADTVFGYDHDDWLHVPLVPPEVPAHLTPQQIEETLQYFLLCSERVSRITKTYHDIDAVTSLLDEKERDLELAARIGQSLLKHNQSLTERNELLEEQLDVAKEEIAQLRHEVSMRDDLLHIYTDTTDESEPVSAASMPLPRTESSLSLQQYFQYDTLQQKLKVLEEENQKLRLEATNIATETCHYEDQEQQLMIDCVEQFSEASQQVAFLSEELARKVEDTARQQEEISQLLAQVVDLQQKCRVHGTEMEELQQHLATAKEIQQQLSTELQDLQEKYMECGGMLHEAQEEIKSLRNRSLPNSTINRYSSCSLLPMDSLAAEIKGTMRKGNDSSSSSEYKSYLRVFETVKAANQVFKAKSRSGSPPNLSGSKQSSVVPSMGCSRVSTPRTSCYGSDSASLGPEERGLVLENMESGQDEGGEEKRRGMPGTPGRHDLEAALQRLSARQENHTSECSFFEMEREHKLKRLKEAESSSGFLTPNESVLSTGTNYSGSSEHTGGSGFSLGSLSYLPDKLQIVKPLEGSVTLHHWQELAKPNLGGILDPRPGVLTKHFRQLDVDLEEVYNLNDFEEDDVDLGSFQALATSTPSRAKEHSSLFHSVNNLPQTQSTYTITTCHILHPSNEITTVTPSLYNTVVSSCGPIERLIAASPVPQCHPLEQSPHALERIPQVLGAPLGLVTLLLEHGISATVQSGETQPVCQAPETSSWLPPSLAPLRLQRDSLQSRSLPGFGLAQTFLSNAERDDGRASELSGCQSRSNIFSLNLVEKLKRLGLDKVVARGEASYWQGAERKQPAKTLTTTALQ
ncbi:PREDICTED: huntingtin-associated protein 1, partial [Crocodylus porosus]|uniref:huntingtin-associated protein 1 n=1 Tax=Crocodylus porosus TaxID=8502 RepID=UPI00093AE3D8